ncbi:MAG: thiamine-phosphate kinase, partial [Pseudomonadota bacterium]
AASVPLSAAALEIPEALHSALTGGDDYELLFTVPSGAAGALDAISREIDLRLTPIGMMIEGSEVLVRDKHGQPIRSDRSGWRHF